MLIPTACKDCAGHQGTVSIATRDTTHEELDLVEVSPIRKAEQEKAIPFPNKNPKCRILGKQLYDLEE